MLFRRGGALVMYVAYAKATVTIHPRRAAVETERVLPLAEEPKGEAEIPAEILEVTVAGERTGAPTEAPMSAESRLTSAPWIWKAPPPPAKAASTTRSVSAHSCAQASDAETCIAPVSTRVARAPRVERSEVVPRLSTSRPAPPAPLSS